MCLFKINLRLVFKRQQSSLKSSITLSFDYICTEQKPWIIDFNIFELYTLFLGKYWYFSLPVGLFLTGFSVIARNKAWRWRIISFVIGLIFIFPTIGYATFFSNYQARKAHIWTLERARNVAGIGMGAGSKIYFQTDFNMILRKRGQLENIRKFYFTVPTMIFDVTVKNYFVRWNGKWEGVLYGKQMIEGFPCTGEVVLDPQHNYRQNGKLIRCTLAEKHSIFNHTLPAGTRIELQPEDWTFYLPEGKVLRFDPKTGTILFNSSASN